MALIALMLAACGLSERFEAPPPVEATYAVVQGEGWTGRVPDQARLVQRPGTLQVDAPDGSWWFDVSWVGADTPFPPLALVTTWAERSCQPVQWDEPAEPAPGVFTVAGFCTIGFGRYWVVATIEPVGDGRLLTGVIANRNAVTYEDLWVHTYVSALSLQGGDTPATTLAADTVRERLRLAYDNRPEGHLPRPGGGTLSRVVSASLAEVWRGREARPPPLQPPTPPPDETRPADEASAGREEAEQAGQ